MADAEAGAPALHLNEQNFGAYPRVDHQTRIASRFYGEAAAIDACRSRLGQAIGPREAAELGLVTAALDDIDWADEVRLMLEQQIMHLPEPALRAGALSRFRSHQRLGMGKLEGKMPEHHAQAIGKLSHQQRHGWCRHLATGTFEVSVLDHGDGSVVRPLDVIGVKDHRYPMKPRRCREHRDVGQISCKAEHWVACAKTVAGQLPEAGLDDDGSLLQSRRLHRLEVPGKGVVEPEVLRPLPLGLPQEGHRLGAGQWGLEQQNDTRMESVEGGRGYVDRTGSGGTVRVYRSIPAATHPRWAVPASTAYTGAVQVTVDGRVIYQMTDFGLEWLA